MLYPGVINPLKDYISYLGDYGRNPIGANWYNLGCIFGGVSIVIFSVGFGIWYTENQIQRLLILITQIAGICDGIMLILVGIFEQGSELHGTMSSLFFIVNLGFFSFSLLSLFPHPKFFKMIGVFGIIVTFFNLSYSLGLHEIFDIPNPLIEWTTVFTALGYILFLVINTCMRLK
jgi:hypothetical membrane protein